MKKQKKKIEKVENYLDLIKAESYINGLVDGLKIKIFNDTEKIKGGEEKNGTRLLKKETRTTTTSKRTTKKNR